MTELGEIPEEWEIKKLKDISKVIDSLHETPIYSENGFPMLRVVDVNGKAIDTSKANKVSEEIYLKFTRKYEPQKEDIIMSRVGSYGLVSYLKDNNKVCLGQNIVVITTNDLYKRYLFYSLNSNYIKSNIDKVTVGSSQKTLSLNNINEFVIAIPPLQEQQKIASILSTVDEQIDNVDALIEKNKELKKGLMQTLLTKGIGHTKFKKTEIGEIPEGWKIIKFFDFVEKTVDFRGRTPKKLGLDWGDGDIQALSANNVKMGKIDFSLECYLASEELYKNWMSGCELKKNDIIMTMEAPLGNVALVPDERKYILSQRVIALKTKDYINNEFMKYMLMSEKIQNQLEKLSTGTTAKGINQKNLSKVCVLIPSLKEQEKIASILSSVDEKIEEYENKKEKLEELKKGLMQQLLTGKIRVI